MLDKPITLIMTVEPEEDNMKLPNLNSIAFKQDFGNLVCNTLDLLRLKKLSDPREDYLCESKWDIHVIFQDKHVQLVFQPKDVFSKKAALRKLVNYQYNSVRFSVCVCVCVCLCMCVKQTGKPLQH